MTDDPRQGYGGPGAMAQLEKLVMAVREERAHLTGILEPVLRPERPTDIAPDRAERSAIEGLLDQLADEVHRLASVRERIAL